MKLKLRLDEPHVDTFQTGAAGMAAQTADNTCGHTCKPPSCNPDNVCGCA